MAKLSEVEEMLEKAEANEENEKKITGRKNKKDDHSEEWSSDSVSFSFAAFA